MGLNYLIATGLMASNGVPRGCLSVSHLCFADDILIFTRADRRSVRSLMAFLTLYEKGSGQKVNLAKSFFILSEKSLRGCARCVSAITGMARRCLPIGYLGCTLFKGRPKGAYFEPFITKVSQRLAGWLGKLLTTGGCLILIKHVLLAMPLHMMAVMDPLKSTLKTLEKLMSHFFWSSSDGSHRRHWLSWDKLCGPKQENGLGLRQLDDVCMAFGCKLWWKFRSRATL
ncbi:uncharacterized protein [Coffea arabica]|uniref:Reverse transcriptase domain-containing protein n=1 Tax=Coffea arabica TaxID=13443 RepID=A0ABM4W2Y6_COFAR